MYDFFSRLKELKPDGLFGLAIPGHAELLPAGKSLIKMSSKFQSTIALLLVLIIFQFA